MNKAARYAIAALTLWVVCVFLDWLHWLPNQYLLGTINGVVLMLCFAVVDHTLFQKYKEAIDEEEIYGEYKGISFTLRGASTIEAIEVLQALQEVESRSAKYATFDSNGTGSQIGIDPGKYLHLDGDDLFYP